MEWVSCGKCGAPVRTRSELITHIEDSHMDDDTSFLYKSIRREDLQAKQRQMRQTSCGEGWTEHMYMNKTVLRCKGTVGFPYTMVINGNKVSVQKLCPAMSIVSEPHSGRYRLQLCTRHAGHNSVAWGDESNRKLIAELKGLLAAAMATCEELCVADIEKVIEKATQFGTFVTCLQNDRDNNLKVQKRDITPIEMMQADKAVDEALEKYIQSKTPVIRIEPLPERPKIVNTFSLSDKTDDIEDFVKDMELLVNEGKSYKAVENSIKLGHVGDLDQLKEEEIVPDVTEEVNQGESETVSQGEKKGENNDETLEPTNSPSKSEQWLNKSTFNDTYKDFINKQIANPNYKAPSSRQSTLRRSMPNPHSPKLYSPKSVTPQSYTHKPETPKLISPEADIPKHLTPKLSTPRSAKSKPIPPKTVTPKPNATKHHLSTAKKKHKTKVSKDEILTDAALEEILSGKTDESPVTKIVKEKTVKPSKKIPEELNSLKRKSTRSAGSLSQIVIPLKKRMVSFNNNVSITKANDRKKPEKIASQNLSKENDKPKNPISVRQQPDKQKLQTSPSSRPTWKIRNLKQLSKAQVSNNTEKKTSPVKSKTGLKSKPINKPKKKVKLEKMSPEKVSLETNEFIVKEQKDDVNILIIRM